MVTPRHSASTITLTRNISASSSLRFCSYVSMQFACQVATVCLDQDRSREITRMFRWDMKLHTLRVVRCPVGLGLVALLSLVAEVSVERIGESGPAIRLEVRTRLSAPVEKLFSGQQIALLEKLNRADREHLDRLKVLAVPDRWDLDELAYSPLPQKYEGARTLNKALVVHVPGQVFGAYEQGRLVRWGPVSSGVAHCP